MLTGDIPQEMRHLESSLDETMKLYSLRENPSLRASICGFASSVLAKYLSDNGVGTEMQIGTPIDKVPEGYPKRMRRHVLVDTVYGKLDPTYSQFMTLVGLDSDLAIKYEELNLLYPKEKIDVIPIGQERAFGERFADFALGSIKKIRDVKHKTNAEISESRSLDDVCVRMPEDEAFEMIADAWNPRRYKLFDNEGDFKIYAQEAVKYLKEAINSCRYGQNRQ